jgi:CCR4-NOT complex subunit CAF16
MKPATIIYATHIFDGLGAWPTHVAHIHAGTIDRVYTMADMQALYEQIKGVSYSSDSPLLLVVEGWLRKDFQESRNFRRKIASGKTIWQQLGDDEAARKHGDKYYDYTTARDAL